jgi:hypothetical protein
MPGAVEDRGTLRGIARTFLGLALLAERVAGRSFPVRFLVLAILYRGEKIARAFVARTSATLIAEAIEAGFPDCPFPDLACLDEPTGLHYGEADAVLLALRLRVLAAVLGMLSDAEQIIDGGSAVFSGNQSGWPGDWPAVAAPQVERAPLPPLLLVVRLPATRRVLRPPDTS